MSDSEKLIQLIEDLRRRHHIPPDLMMDIYALVGLIAYSETVQQ
jgi:hypothetical protein